MFLMLGKLSTDTIQIVEVVYLLKYLLVSMVNVPLG